VTDPMADLERRLKPYRDQVPSFRELPADGLARAEVTSLVERLAAAEERTWREGYASGAVYHGDPEHVAFLSGIYTAQSQSNPFGAQKKPRAFQDVARKSASSNRRPASSTPTR
jgi:sphinganine-1-phosphate aldolase